MQVYFDGACPLCRKEIAWLRRRDRHGKLQMIDISAAEFDGAAVGRSYDQLMGELHARLPDGRWITGVEVFQRMYSAVGLGFLTSWTRLPGIRFLVERAYAVFARYRLRWTGRSCADGVCKR